MPHKIVIIGAGPAGLAAAEALSSHAFDISIYEAMPTAGRKFLMAGKSGLNLSHAEPFDAFKARYGDNPWLEQALDHFTPEMLVSWANGLGAECFTGSSGRIFPKAMKAAPLLRAWLARLHQRGVTLHTRHRWTGWRADGALQFTSPGGNISVQPDATILALGGASWPRLGSDAAWVPWLEQAGVLLAPFKPANMGFDVAWSDVMKRRFAGHAVKNCVLSHGGVQKRGDFVISDYGIEGSAVYSLSTTIRDTIAAGQSATLVADLAPDHSADVLAAKLARPRGKRSLTDHLRRTTGITGVKAGLLRECLPTAAFGDPAALAAAIKAVPIVCVRPRPIAEAISSAGGLCFSALDENLMLRALPGTFACGEMLNWEAPTGGYLITGCMALGRMAGHSAARWLETKTGS